MQARHLNGSVNKEDIRMQISTGNKICSISLVIKEIYKKKKEIYTVGYHCTPTRMPTSTKADTMW